MSTFYRVTVTNPGSLVAPANGFIDNLSVERYLAAAAAPAGFNYAKAQAKERGNLRYADVIAQIGIVANGYASNWTAAGADAGAEATSFAFTVEVERGDEVLVTRNEAGGADLTGAPALKRAVARAIIASRSHTAQVYDPTETLAPNGPGASNAIARMAARTETLVVGPLAANLTAAEALVTVAKISNVG